MKGIILLANHFEDVEALITIDMLRRAKITIDLVSMTSEKLLTTQSNIKLFADYLLEEVNYNDYDFLVIPGGKAVFETHLKSEITKKIVNDFNDKNKLIYSVRLVSLVHLVLLL
jgi:4-methyl-5(b-hydroxyethyl)-thiazole monophosphate biosynthesis